MNGITYLGPTECTHPSCVQERNMQVINFIYTLFPEKKLCSRVFTTGTLIKQTKNIINDAKS